jgi:uncharacterized membrane protein YgcG
MRKIKWILLCILLAFFFVLPVHADNTEYVIDNDALLSTSEVAQLNKAAEEVSKKYNVGVYIRIEKSSSGYASIEKYAEALYDTEKLGYGTGTSRECVALVLTMDNRHYDIMAHGDTANAAFTDYGKNALAEDVVDYLRDDEWYEGLSAFITESGSYLAYAAAGTPIDVNNADPAGHARTMLYLRYGLTFGGAPLIALIVCLIIKSKNHTKGIMTQAVNYVPEGGIQLTGQQDIFLYRTETVTHINRDRGGGGGGTSINSGGFSHSSGSF